MSQRIREKRAIPVASPCGSRSRREKNQQPGVPVVENEGKIIGVISEKDFLFRMGTKDTRSFMGILAHCLKSKGCIAISMREQKAEDIMTSPPIIVNEDTPISEITSIFTEKNINRVPVTDKADKLIGIVARANIAQASFSKLNRR